VDAGHPLPYGEGVFCARQHRLLMGQHAITEGAMTFRDVGWVLPASGEAHVQTCRCYGDSVLR
jgi:hypothetical protein